MPDVFTPDKRSMVMSRIRSKNTRAEVVVFRYLRQQHIYVQKHYTRAPGCPDIALPRKKKAIFIDGDFWHGRTYDALVKRRGGSDDYWPRKIAANMARDAQQRGQLQAKGWTILEVWASDIMRKKTREETLSRIKEFILA